MVRWKGKRCMAQIEAGLKLRTNGGALVFVGLIRRLVASAVGILIARIGTNASHRIGEDVIPGRTEVPRSVGEDRPGDGARDESRAVADGILVDEHAIGREAGVSAACNAGTVYLDRTTVAYTAAP